MKPAGFQQAVLSWFDLHGRSNLPWQLDINPYRVWVSEIMLQQTRVAQGLSYYKKFTEAFPTIFELAKANESTILKMWQGLGYYSRARNLHFTAKYIVTELNGEFPSTFNEIIKLKENNGNISGTARNLGMHRRTLQRKLLKRPVKQ